MKKIIFVLLASAFLFSCEKEENQHNNEKLKGRYKTGDITIDDEVVRFEFYPFQVHDKYSTALTIFKEVKYINNNYIVSKELSYTYEYLYENSKIKIVPYPADYEIKSQSTNFVGIIENGVEKFTFGHINLVTYFNIINNHTDYLGAEYDAIRDRQREIDSDFIENNLQYFSFENGEYKQVFPNMSEINVINFKNGVLEVENSILGNIKLHKY